MRGKVFFVVLGLCFFVGCTGTACLEIKNSANSDLDLEITKGAGDFKKDTTVKKGTAETIVIELAHSNFRAMFDSPIRNTVNVKIKNEDKSLTSKTVTENETTTITIKSNLQDCPDSRLAGKWKNSSDGTFTFYADNNKCKVTATEWNRTGYTGFYQWKLEDGKFFLRAWVDYYVEGSEFYEWNDWDYFEYIDSSNFKIGKTDYQKTDG